LRPVSEEREDRWRGWMVAAQAGDAACYEKLLRELIPYLARFVARRLLDVSAAEDVVQNVLISLHRARHTYRTECRFSPWLHAIARNAIIDHMRVRARRANREVSLESDRVPEPAADAVETPAPELSPELQRAVESLTGSQREAVELIHVHGLSVAEAATRAGVTKTALKVRAHRGYRALRAHIEASRLEGSGS
jgi:RNA polymerase sigma-70 factor (ECF subfamily)